MRTLLALIALFSTTLFANESVASADAASGAVWWYAIGAALAIALPALGGALGQGRAAAAALEGIARNPGAANKIFTPMILAMALIESLVLFGLLIAFLLFGKI